MSLLVFRNVKGVGRYGGNLSCQEFESFVRAKSSLSDYLHLESIYDQIIKEYWRYKNYINYWCLRSVSKPNDYILNHDVRGSLNRISFNILNLSKLFLDLHYSKDGRNCFSGGLTCDDNDSLKG
ncbi:hypothetical protein TDB9533_01214 [Thalassocella blandensis]|nr:hypothetical protein TDB9533_01214 [Thalassocella blandensis]